MSRSGASTEPVDDRMSPLPFERTTIKRYLWEQDSSQIFAARWTMVSRLLLCSACTMATFSRARAMLLTTAFTDLSKLSLTLLPLDDDPTAFIYALAFSNRLLSTSAEISGHSNEDAPDGQLSPLRRNDMIRRLPCEYIWAQPSSNSSPVAPRILNGEQKTCL